MDTTMTDWPTWLLAAIEILAVHRLVRLVTEDVITVRPRWAIIRWSYLRSTDLPAEVLEPDDGPSSQQLDSLVDADMTEDPCGVPKLATLVRCRWCASVWIAAGAVLAHGLAPHQWLPIAAVLALSSASTLLAGLEQ